MIKRTRRRRRSRVAWRERSPTAERWRLWIAVGVVPGCALLGLDRAFQLLAHLHIWAAYGNFFAFLAAGLVISFLLSSYD